MTNLNCWEFRRCGREPGGKNAPTLGVCPAAVDGEADGINRGKYGGRICWAIAGTMCDSEPSGSFVGQVLVCSDCEFYKRVKAEEGFLEYRILKPSQLK